MHRSGGVQTIRRACTHTPESEEYVHLPQIGVYVFLRHRLVVESSPPGYDTIEQKHRPEVSFDLYDDDNGPGSEPPPQDRLRLVSAVTPSHRQSPAAVGKQSFACFSAAIVTGRLCRPNNPTTQRPSDLDYASKQRSPEDSKGMYIDAGIKGICTSASGS